MKRFLLLFVGFIFIIMLSSCSSIEVNTADTVRHNTWKNTFKNSVVISLKFNDDTATLKVKDKSADSAQTIKGICIIDDKNIIISDSSTDYTFVFSYKVSGNRLKLTFDDNTVTLKNDSP